MTQHRAGVFIVAFVCLFLGISGAVAQDRMKFGGKAGSSLMGSYAPTSQHVFIGHAEARKTIQAGFGYSHDLKRWSGVALVYEGTVEPFYLESDPAIVGTSTANALGPPTINTFPLPFRPIGLHMTFGEILSGNVPIPITPVYGPRENTYAFGALPIGARLVGLTRSRIQPTLSVDLGALYATRNIPVDSTSSFNFLAYTGPGIEVYWDKSHSIRMEYLYEHLSNAELGAQNPGVDSATFRITVTQYH